MAQQKSKIYNPLPWLRAHKFYSLLLFTVLSVAGVFVYEKVALGLNKRAFLVGIDVPASVSISLYLLPASGRFLLSILQSSAEARFCKIV